MILMQDLQAFFISSTALIIWFALIPNMSNKAADGPLRGIPVTARRVTIVFRQQLTAEATASPIPPKYLKLIKQKKLIKQIKTSISISQKKLNT